MRILSPSLAAMTVSVASSPIFFRIASSPLANSAATYDEAGSALLRDSIVCARRCRTSPPSCSAAICARLLEHGFDAHPALVFETVEKAALVARVAGDAAGLIDDEQ